MCGVCLRSCTYILGSVVSTCQTRLGAQLLLPLTGGPCGTCDQAETARTLVLRDSCLVAAWRSAVLDDASMLELCAGWRRGLVESTEGRGTSNRASRHSVSYCSGWSEQNTPEKQQTARFAGASMTRGRHDPSDSLSRNIPANSDGRSLIFMPNARVALRGGQSCLFTIDTI